MVKELCKVAKAVLILDHHKSAQETLESLKPIDWNFATEPDDISGAFAFFHMGKSGARLAWEYFHPHLRVPKMVTLVEDYDLWNFKFEDTRALHEYLSSVKQTVGHWNYANWSVENDPAKDGIIGIGWHIYQTKMLVVEDLIKGVRVLDMGWNLSGGTRVNVAFQYAPRSLTDYTGEKLVELGHEIACLWRIDGDKVSISLRSKKGGDRDVSKIAKLYNGGGHQSSAGFQIGLEDFLNWM
jgi:oligoribonuclease NrnB/cAMP/cGMP phosphodiesterase (DHH superfamily)